MLTDAANTVNAVNGSWKPQSINQLKNVVSLNFVGERGNLRFLFFPHIVLV